MRINREFSCDFAAIERYYAPSGHGSELKCGSPPLHAMKQGEAWRRSIIRHVDCVPSNLAIASDRCNRDVDGGLNAIRH
jgi:hypothetical protein